MAKRNGGKCYLPLFDKDYATERVAWLEGLRRWEAGEIEDFQHGWRPRGDASYEQGDFWEYDAPPDRTRFRPSWNPEEMTAFQVYETVSEGTPISPVLASLEEVADWLIVQGYSPEAARAFCADGFAVSFVIRDGVLRDGIAAAAS